MWYHVEDSPFVQLAEDVQQVIHNTRNATMADYGAYESESFANYVRGNIHWILFIPLAIVSGLMVTTGKTGRWKKFVCGLKLFAQWSMGIVVVFYVFWAKPTMEFARYQAQNWTALSWMTIALLFIANGTAGLAHMKHDHKAWVALKSLNYGMISILLILQPQDNWKATEHHIYAGIVFLLAAYFNVARHHHYRMGQEKKKVAKRRAPESTGLLGSAAGSIQEIAHVIQAADTAFEKLQYISLFVASVLLILPDNSTPYQWLTQGWFKQPNGGLLIFFWVLITLQLLGAFFALVGKWIKLGLKFVLG